jgi:hypothetical protein
VIFAEIRNNITDLQIEKEKKIKIEKKPRYKDKKIK